MSKELDALIKREKDETHPTVARPLVELYLACKALQVVALNVRNKTAKMKLSDMDKIMKAIFTSIDNAESVLKQYTSSQDTRLKLLVPVGIQRVFNQLRRVTKDIYTVTIEAGKSERLKPSEVADIISTSFPIQALSDMLMSNEARVTQHHLKQRMGADKQSDMAMKKVADQFKKSYNKLPTSLGGKLFSAFEMPVVPLFADMAVQIDPSVLTRIGIKVTQIGDGFTVLDRQMLLAFDHKAMGWKSNLRISASGSKTIHMSAPKSVIKGNSQVDDIREVLDQINAKSSTKYDLASTMFVANPRSPAIWLAWIIPANQRQRMQQEMKTTEVQWDLPFSRKYTSDED